MTSLLEFQIAYIDLTTQTLTVKTLPRSVFDLYLGGRGLNAKLLFEGQKKGVDPLGPDNLLIFGTGKLVGTPVPTAGQVTITSKSPATDLYFKSNTGGVWAKALRRAGWDAVVFSGASERPVLVSIDDDQVDFHDAGHLWGKSVRETWTQAQAQLPGRGWDLALIGQAGENLVRYACIMTSLYHAAGRGGLGAVMGSKKLKAVAVRGSGRTAVADEAALEAEVASVLARIKDSVKANLYFDYGTSATVEYVNESWSMPVNNFQKSHLDDGHKISGSYLVEKGYMRHGSACSACPLGCHKFFAVKDGPFKSYSGGPEYETLASLGAGCGITDVEPVLKGAELCNDYGLDTISAGGAIQWLIETVERGVLPPDVAEGLDLSWGNAQTMVTLIQRIALRQGVGDLLAEGTRRAAEKVGGGSWKWAVQANGLEQSRVDTRVAKAYGLAFAVNPRGPDHLHAQPMAEFGHFPEARRLVEKILGSDKYANPTAIEGKPELVRWHEDVFALTDSLGICSFTTTSSYIVDLPSLLKMVRAALGVDWDETELLKAGQRTIVLERCFNLRENPRRQDVLPWRLMNDPVAEGPLKGNLNSESELKGMLAKYYELQGYDPATGRPTRAVLSSLGLLDDVQGLDKILET
ncbi:MAG: aldehyde ferredoxin oxidoreductase family protein, partial [Deltaproteobacteria bacterium]|nr:aldehyde ferredoxin oxidoreductase family protein [Deltaproteobacteria bacterium]